MTEPTDDEIVALAIAEGVRVKTGTGAIRLVRAALSKWGTPAPVGVEPYGWHYWNIAGTSVLHLGRSNKLDADIAASKKHPEVHHVVPLYTTPPTQAQPVAREPLSAEQYNILVEDLSEWSRHVEVDTAPRSLEEHIHQVFAIHGIKGGQHGAE